MSPSMGDGKSTLSRLFAGGKGEQMKHVYIALLVVFAMVLGSDAHAGNSGRGHYLVGLWQGIDPTDGSEMLRSITENRDGTFSIIGTESYFVGCRGDRGKVFGTGIPDGDMIVFRDFQLVCFGGDYFDDSDDVYFSSPMVIVADRLNRTIVEQYGNPNFSDAVLHRISKK